MTSDRDVRTQIQPLVSGAPLFRGNKRSAEKKGITAELSLRDLYLWTADLPWQSFNRHTEDDPREEQEGPGRWRCSCQVGWLHAVLSGEYRQLRWRFDVGSGSITAVLTTRSTGAN